jgi:hypothetical protein
MASDVGPIPRDGGNYLPFLISVREVVESDTTIEDRRERLRQTLDATQWPEYVIILGGPKKIIAQFFPSFLISIGGLTNNAIEQLEHANLRTAADLAEATNEKLLNIKGVGLAKLEKIRNACESAPDKHAVWIDKSRSSQVGPGAFLHDEMDHYQTTQEYLKRGGNPSQTDYQVLAEIAADNAQSALADERRDDAWRYLSEQKMHYMKYANQAGLSADEHLKLDGKVSVMQAGILNTEGKYPDALTHMIYCLGTQGEAPSEQQELELIKCFDNCGFECVTFEDFKYDLANREGLGDFVFVQQLVREWQNRR